MSLSNDLAHHSGTCGTDRGSTGPAAASSAVAPPGVRQDSAAATGTSGSPAPDCVLADLFDPIYRPIAVNSVLETRDPDLCRQLLSSGSSRKKESTGAPVPMQFRILRISPDTIYTISLNRALTTEKPAPQPHALICQAVREGTLYPVDDPVVPMESPTQKMLQRRNYLMKLFRNMHLADTVIEDRHGEYAACIRALMAEDRLVKEGAVQDLVLEAVLDDRLSSSDTPKALRDPISRKQFQRYITAYWRGGMIPDALLARYEKQGRPSRVKAALKKLEGSAGADAVSGSGGRDPAAAGTARSAASGESPEGPYDRFVRHLTEGSGRQCAADTKGDWDTGDGASDASSKDPWEVCYAQFADIIDRRWARTDGMNLTQAYECYKRTYCKVGNDANGDVLFLPEDQIPSISQFAAYTIAYINRDPAHYTKCRLSGSDYELLYRPVMAHEDSFCPGPGSIYAADASPVLDTELVDTATRTFNIGRCSTTILIDLYSRAITGICCMLRDESYTSYRLALYCAAVRDKAAFFKRLGVITHNEDWPADGIPAEILSDNGPMLGEEAGKFCSELGITVNNTISHRGDLKGIVESLFHTIHLTLKAYIRGVVDSKKRANGGKDNAYAACLTYTEYLQILVDFVGVYNRTHRISLVPEADFFFHQDLEMNPLSLWKHGMKYRCYDVRSVDAYILNIRLLPSAKATCSRNGLCLNGFGLHYKEEHFVRAFARTSDRFIDAGQLPALRDRQTSITVHYSPMLMDRVFQYDKESGCIVVWILTGGDGGLLYGKGLMEIRALQNEMKRMKKAQLQQSSRAVNGLIERTEAAVDAAARKTKAALGKTQLDLTDKAEHAGREQLTVSGKLIAAEFDLYETGSGETRQETSGEMTDLHGTDGSGADCDKTGKKEVCLSTGEEDICCTSGKEDT